tara:strand:- start:5914 stop:6312 length:399 start_codon:yes stop_codon:yes gene_type:complete
VKNVLLISLLIFFPFGNQVFGQNIECVKIGQSIFSVWNHSENINYNQKIKVGQIILDKPTNSNYDSGCIGRCGEGCGKDGSGYYTLDCLNHDMCTFYDSKFGWIFDRDCGDELVNAIDDFLFGKECYIKSQD